MHVCSIVIVLCYKCDVDIVTVETCLKCCRIRPKTVWNMS